MTLKNTTKPIIGIIGGAGPYATIDFQAELAQQMSIKLDAIADQDHYRVIIDNYTTMPDRSLSLVGNVASPIKHMQAAALTLEQLGCDILAYPCNTAHAFLPEIQQALTIPIVDMLAETSSHIKSQPSINKVGIMCTNMTRKLHLYNDLGVESCYPDDKHQAKVMQAIFAAKAGYSTTAVTKSEHQAKIMQYLQQESDLSYDIENFKYSPQELFTAAIANLAQQGADAILLGCTEIPLCIKQQDHDIKIINPTQILAAAVVDQASKL